MFIFLGNTSNIVIGTKLKKLKISPHPIKNKHINDSERFLTLSNVWISVMPTSEDNLEWYI